MDGSLLDWFFKILPWDRLDPIVSVIVGVGGVVFAVGAFLRRRLAQPLAHQRLYRDAVLRAHRRPGASAGAALTTILAWDWLFRHDPPAQSVGDPDGDMPSDLVGDLPDAVDLPDPPPDMGGGSLIDDFLPL